MSRDILIEVQRLLNDNKHMNVHPILSAMANEIVNLRCEIARLEQENFELKVENSLHA